MTFLSSFPLTFNDVLTAAFWALLIVVLIRLLGWAFRTVLIRTSQITFDPARAAEVRKRCSRLFPIEHLQFEGATFSRGHIIRVITHRQDAFEGEFMGANDSNILCLVTNCNIIAQELRAIETIQVIGRAAV